MPNPREPINILLAKGRKHLTQEEIQRRMATEPTAPADDIQPPEYLSKKQREEFSALAEELQRIKIIGNVDAGELARYVVAHGFYARYTKLLRTLPKKKRARLRRGGKGLLLALLSYGLNHLFMPSPTGAIAEVLHEYQQPQAVDSQVIADIARWILAHEGAG